MEVDEGVYAGVFVVIALRKTALLKKTIYHLWGLNGDEFWIRLKRGKKGGIPFRPLRRVMDVKFIDVKFHRNKELRKPH